MRKLMVGLLMLAAMPALAGNMGGTAQFVAPYNVGYVLYAGLPSSAVSVKTFSGIVLVPGSCDAFGEGASCGGGQGMSFALTSMAGPKAACFAALSCEAALGTTFACAAQANTLPQGSPVLFTVAQTGCQYPPLVNVQANY